MASFPASKYVRYMCATAFFLDWLLRARGNGHHVDKRVQLETLNEVVNEISAEPSILTPKLLKDFPKALTACQCVITLREHVANFFADVEHSHQHFLEQLRNWLNILKKVEVELEAEGKFAADVESAKFEKYYEVLDVDEDYFPDEGTYVTEPSVPKNFKVDRQRLLVEAFAEDMKLEVVYFFVELEEHLETVVEMYSLVKNQQRSILEATVVTKLALDTANSLTATLQLRYPSLRTEVDFYHVIWGTETKALADSMTQALESVQKTMETDGVQTCFWAGYAFIRFLQYAKHVSVFYAFNPSKASVCYNVSAGLLW